MLLLSQQTESLEAKRKRKGSKRREAKEAKE
jgi:hypothetical protein